MSITSKKRKLEEQHAEELAVDAATEESDAAVEAVGDLQSERAEEPPEFPAPVDPYPGMSTRDKMAQPPDPDEEARFRAKKAN